MINADLKEWVQRNLGAPTRNVEITEEQLDDCINFALGEIQPWYTMYHFLTIELNHESAIDLNEYNIYEVTDVIKIPNTAKTNGNNLNDPFSYPMMGMGSGMGGGVGLGNLGQNYFSRLTNNSIHKVISANAKQWDTMFYTRLAGILQQRTLGSILPALNYTFNREDGWLYIDPGYPGSPTVTIEYAPLLTTFEQIYDSRYIRVAQDFALGKALELQGRVTGKYDVSNAPSKVNYEAMRSDAKELIDNSKKEIRSISRTTWISD